MGSGDDSEGGFDGGCEGGVGAVVGGVECPAFRGQW